MEPGKKNGTLESVVTSTHTTPNHVYVKDAETYKTPIRQP